MSEDRLRQLLRDEPVPGSGEARGRGRRLVEGAYERRPRRARRSLPRIAAAVATVAVLTAGVLSPAGAAVRDWVGDVFATTGVPEAERGLTGIPGGGRLLVRSAEGPWVVQPDGSRRLLGDYREATWSPHGLFVAAASGRDLSALEPDGTPRWSLTAPSGVADVRWSPSGYRIAYRAGRSLRVVAGDGTGDALLDRRVEPVAPAWSPRARRLLAYVDAGEKLRLVGSEDAERLASAPALPGIEALEWDGERSTLMEASPEALRLRAPGRDRLLGDPDLAATFSARPPAGAEIGAAALSPDGATVALVFSRERQGARRSDLVLLDAVSGGRRHLLSVRGRLGRLEWSPDGRRLLVAWPEADQWLFIPTGGRGRVRAIGGIAAEFAPGAAGAAQFPAVAGWCCRATAER